MSEPFLLRPLPPKEMVPLKLYAEILFEKNNEELIDYFKQFEHDFKSGSEENLMVNELAMKRKR